MPYLYLGSNLSNPLARAARELYLNDQVEGALETIEPISGEPALGPIYRLIEGEARTRNVSEQVDLASWLRFEWVRGEVPHGPEAGEVVLLAAKTVADRLQWDKHEKVLATILVAEADAEWNEARYGYCVDKTPYDKICMPQVAARDKKELWRVALHEFAHVVILNTTRKAAPRWLDEGIACLMEGRNAQAAAQRLKLEGTWLPPEMLEAAFSADRRDPSAHRGVRSAYDQATVLVTYLHSQYGDAGIVCLLRSFADNSMWTEFTMRLKGKMPAEEALQETFRLGQSALFDKAAAWAGK